MRIKKVSETTPTMASIVNATNNSTTDAYSCDYINKDNTYSTSEIKTNKVWIDGKPIYRKVIVGNSITFTENTTKEIQTNISNVDTNTRLDINLVYRDGTQFKLWNTKEIFFRPYTGIIGITITQNVEMESYQIVLEYTKTTD